MSIRTQCLNAMAICITINPMSFAQLINFMVEGKRKNNEKDLFLQILFLVYCILIVSIVVINKELFNTNLGIEKYWYVVAVLAAPCIIGFEILTVYIVMKIKGSNIQGVNIVSKWEKNNFKPLICIVSIGILEEVVYRLVWFNVLNKVLAINIIVTIIISAVFYAYNHRVFGKYVLIQKVLAGCVFGSLYYLSGYSIIVTIIAHGLQNIIIVTKDMLSQKERV